MLTVFPDRDLLIRLRGRVHKHGHPGRPEGLLDLLFDGLDAVADGDPVARVRIDPTPLTVPAAQIARDIANLHP